MQRSVKMGRKSTANNTRFFTARFACRISVAISAFMHFPAYFASCSFESPDSGLRVRVERTASSNSALDVFVFEGEAPYLLDSYQQFPAGEAPVYVVSGPGKKRIVAISSTTGDLYSRSGVSRYQDLSKESFSLLNDSPDNPFCYGEAYADEGSSRDIALYVKPLLSSIRVRSVSCYFIDRPYQDLQFHNDTLSLVNVVSETCLAGAEGGRPVSWLNYGSRTENHPFITAAGVGVIGSERINCNVVLYCYPNPSGSPPTRLVLEGTVGEDRCYYPITIPVLKSGTRLVLDITIGRIGTADPDSEALPGTYTIDYSTEPWYETDTAFEIF